MAEIVTDDMPFLVDSALAALARQGRVVRQLLHPVLAVRRDGAGRLLGAARGVTDSAWCCYLSDLCVDAARHRGGIGRALLAETKRAVGPRCMVLLVSVPSAVGYYARLGMEGVPDAFLIRRDG